MWSRAELKGRAKNCLKLYYWAALAVTFLVGLLGGESGGSVNLGGLNFSRTMNHSGFGALYDLSEKDKSMFVGMVVIIIIITLIVAALAILFKVFVGNVMTVGGCRFFMESRLVGRSAGVGKIFYGFGGGHYWSVVKTQFMKDLFIALWTLLLIIPGIIKAYEYYMVPYILSENPDMPYKEALAMSKGMMDGHKLDTFVLELSFIGWMLLGALMCGIGMFFVIPYIQATLAELYAVLRRNIGPSGLRGFGDEDDVYDHVVYEQ